MSEVAKARFPAGRPEGAIIWLLRIDGFISSQDLHWNRNWRRFRVYVTDVDNTVEIVLRSGRRVLVSPDDPRGFVAAVIRGQGI